MKIRTFVLTLTSNNRMQGSSVELRGFFATKFNEYTLLHQHNADQFIYRYPLVQYKIVEDKHIVIGINEGAKVLKQIYDKCDEIQLGEHKYNITEKGISIKDLEVGFSDKFHKYVFLSPWFALNEENFPKYLKAGPEERQEMLRRILRNNILSMSAGVGNL